MRNHDVVEKVSYKTGVSEKDCERVLDALEDVLEEDLASSEHVGNAVDKVYLRDVTNTPTSSGG